jgi:hypothetical protein
MFFLFKEPKQSKAPRPVHAMTSVSPPSVLLLCTLHDPGSIGSSWYVFSNGSVVLGNLRLHRSGVLGASPDAGFSNLPGVTWRNRPRPAKLHEPPVDETANRRGASPDLWRHDGLGFVDGDNSGGLLVWSRGAQVGLEEAYGGL